MVSLVDYTTDNLIAFDNMHQYMLLFTDFEIPFFDDSF